MNRIFNTIICLGFALMLGMSAVSCESYLDKEPDSTISGETAFVNFRNFQGFVEEIYNCIPDKQKANWCPSWNWGDEEIFNPEADNRMTHHVDLGDFRYLWNNASGGNWLYTPSGGNYSATDRRNHSLWTDSWYCIRKANLGIQALEEGMMVAGTKEEKDLIAGQLYFFRAWWHFELINWFGGLPYIDKAFDAGDDLTLPRLSYQECADKCAEDFRKAADLLPIDWDDTAAGKATAGKNMLRVNKIAALAYLGKCYLWAGSPLMEHGAQTGAIASGRTYEYNTEYMAKSADALGELLELVETGQTQYALAEFDFEDIYNHKKSATATTRYTDNFYTIGQTRLMPGTVEAIFRGPTNGQDWYNQQAWNTLKVFGPKVAGLVEHDAVIHQPTANAVNMYGMANGLPLTDKASGFDETHPYKDRDPRFYHDIIFDGFKFLNGDAKEREPYRYSELFTGGNVRSVDQGSRTGYFIQKLVPHTCNVVDGDYNDNAGIQTYISYVRLADVYLMYAEAAAAKDAGFSKSNASVTYPALTAEAAINKVRARCGVAGVSASYNGTAFMDEIRRERAVELMFEGHRFSDLQRWLLLTEAPYTTKTSHEFNRVHAKEWYTSGQNDPKDAQVSDFREEVILVRQFDTKHYWFPLPDSEVYLYEEFSQNPGW